MVGWLPEFPIGEVRPLRYLKFVENPVLSKTDAEGYMALQEWATQFYEVPV
jgi:hypothetical protein